MPPWARQRVTRTKTLATFASAGVAIVAIFHVVRLVVLQMQVGLLERIAAHDPTAGADAAANDSLVRGVDSAAGLAWFAAGLVFLIWVHAAHASLPGLREDHAEPTPGWAVGVYFVPILNLFRPYQDMATLARLSDPRDLELPEVREVNPSPGYRDAPVRPVARLPWSPPPSVVGIWWAAYIVLTVSAYAIVAMGHDTGVAAAVSRTHAQMGRDVLFIATGALCIGVVRGITACQVERARRLEILAQPAV